MTQNIYLIGMMGSGKTTTARELARMRGMDQRDLDEVIQQVSKKTISQIFAENGEPEFRLLEEDVLNQVSKDSNQVVATGGGVILSLENTEQMKKTGTVIYLKTSFETLWNRVKHSKNRPLLKAESPEKLFKSIFEARKELYKNAANHVVVTDGKSPVQVAQEINSILK